MDNPEQQRRLTALETLAGRQLERAEMVMSLRPTRDSKRQRRRCAIRPGRRWGMSFKPACA